MTATPTPPGETEYSLDVDGLLIDRGFGPQLLPNPEASMRWGLSRNLDFGVRVNALGAEASSRLGLLKLGSYRLTSVPLLGGGLVSVTNKDESLVTTTAGMALLNEVAVTARAAVVLGLRGQFRLDLNSVAVREDFGAATWSFVPGGSLGVRFPVSERLLLFPELVVLVPYELEGAAWQTPVLQGGIAVQWSAH